MSEEKTPYRIEGRGKTIFRVIHDKDNHYITINTKPITNPDLSYKAKGILTYLMSRPDGWEVNIPDLVNHSTDGAAAVRSGLKELKAAGHIRYNVERSGGYIRKWVIEVYEVPGLLPPDVGGEETEDAIDSDFRNVGNSLDSDFLQVGNQQVENQQVENRREVLKNLSNKKLSIKSTTTTTQNTFSYYESNIGALTPFIADAIQQDIDDYSETWVIEAIREAVKSEARNLKYVEAILKRWKRDGFKTQKQPSGPKNPNKSFMEKLAEA